jgi:hypothetical protein
LALHIGQAPKELHGMSDTLLSLNDDGEYMQEFNERIDVLMSVGAARISMLFEPRMRSKV